MSFSRVPMAHPTQSLPWAFRVGLPRGAGYLKSWALSRSRSTTPRRAGSSALATMGRRPFFEEATLARTASSESPA